MSTLLHDIRYAPRSLRHSPGFVAAAVLTLALAIGANTAIFSVVSGVLLRPLPFPQSERLVGVWGHHPAIGRETASQPDFLDWRAGATSFEKMGAAAQTRATLTGEGEPEVLRGVRATADFLPALGVVPALGRGFLAEEESGSASVVVLGHRFWQQRLGADPGAVGRQIQLNGRGHTIVGVLPDGHEFPWEADAWLPLATDTVLPRRSDFLTVVGRLSPGATLARARNELRAIAGGLEEKFPDSNTGWKVELVGLQEQVVGSIRPALLVFMGAVGLVLLIACANVANLMLARLTARDREVTIRSALGASRGRLVRQLLTESLVLALAGGALGVLLAVWGVQALRSLGPDTIPRIQEIGLDWRALTFALAVSLVTGLAFGLAPALRLTGGELQGGLREGGRGSTGGSAVRRLRGGLVLAEVALAFMLLIGAGLLLRSFDRLQRVTPGFEAEGVLTARLLLPRAKYAEDGQQIALYSQLLERLAEVPGVRAAGVVSDAPLGDSPDYIAFALEGAAAPDPNMVQDAEAFTASPGYFDALRMPLLSGRGFAAQDGPDAPPVVVINQTLARRFWPGRDPLGERITFGNPADSAAEWRTVVGVVGDIRHVSLDRQPYGQIYLPLAQQPQRFMVIAVRSAGDPGQALGALRYTLAQLDSDLPLSEVRTMEDRIAGSLARPRVSALLLGGFAASALLLAAIGIYGVISYGVAQRTRELGIRMALGAGSTVLLRLVVIQGMAPVLAGIALGCLGAWAGGRLLQSMLFGVGANDPATFVAVAVFLTAVALAASFVPARRAARSDPMAALRAE
ncbi:MAG: ABC transporter permease [Gemmatimonadales bacterium]